MTGYGSDVYKAPRPSPLEERAKTNFPAMLVVNDSSDNVSRNKSCGFVHIQHHILTHDGASLATCCYLQADFIKDAVPMSALHRSSVRSRFGCDCPRGLARMSTLGPSRSLSLWCVHASCWRHSREFPRDIY
ncbi:hypothetical protein M404DRAFT_996452 [Pisolithus tinctorius Marx 270]|uniref:Uncharacterized protein n=1 Tax=Pisolithus tinctorius Marx 270 TaxID=870435 RepID=A0A0C3KJ62_PISTI|nr:hypothetical protein M404DRAFT_996452 [Pisolithus tinctorius Marx 270]